MKPKFVNLLPGRAYTRPCSDRDEGSAQPILGNMLFGGLWVLVLLVCSGHAGQLAAGYDTREPSEPITVSIQASEIANHPTGENTNSIRPFVKGDAVRIMVAPDSVHFINGIYQIDDNGSVFLPIIGNVKIDTMSEKELSSFLNAVYLHYLRYPSLQVQPLIRVSLLGGFQKPGLFYVSPSSSLWEVVALAGGPVREDGLKKMKWERNGILKGMELLTPMESGVSLATMGIKSGDQLWITHVPKRDGWEIFTTDILPIVSISVSAVSATASLYFVYQTFKGTR
jgi:protein involved in polysaccharide export with SLBB domain